MSFINLYQFAFFARLAYGTVDIREVFSNSFHTPHNGYKEWLPYTFVLLCKQYTAHLLGNILSKSPN